VGRVGLFTDYVNSRAFLFFYEMKVIVEGFLVSLFMNFVNIAD